MTGGWGYSYAVLTAVGAGFDIPNPLGASAPSCETGAIFMPDHQWWAVWGIRKGGRLPNGRYVNPAQSATLCLIVVAVSKDSLGVTP